MVVDLSRQDFQEVKRVSAMQEPLDGVIGGSPGRDAAPAGFRHLLPTDDSCMDPMMLEATPRVKLQRLTGSFADDSRSLAGQ